MKVKRDYRVFETFLSNLPQTLSGTGSEITQEYYTVYNGVAMNIEASQLEWLAKCEVVKKIYKDAEVTINTVEDEEKLDSEDSILNEAEPTENKVINEVKNNEVNENEEPDTVKEYIEENSVQVLDSDIAPLMMDSVHFIDIDALHDEGIDGTGVKVGVLDK